MDHWRPGWAFSMYVQEGHGSLYIPAVISDTLAHLVVTVDLVYRQLLFVVQEGFPHALVHSVVHVRGVTS